MHNKKYFLYPTEFLQYLLVVNFYVEVNNFILQISFCERCQTYERLETQAPNLKTIKVKEPLQWENIDFIVSLTLIYHFQFSFVQGIVCNYIF